MIKKKRDFTVVGEKPEDFDWGKVHLHRGNEMSNYWWDEFHHSMYDKYDSDILKDALAPSKLIDKRLDDSIRQISKKLNEDMLTMRANCGITDFELNFDEPGKVRVDAKVHIPTEIRHVNLEGTLDMKKIKRITIHYDSDTSYDVRDIKETNADWVEKDNPFNHYLKYEQNAPVEIDEGIFQEAKFAVAMTEVTAVDIYWDNGYSITRRFAK
jgi:hypothetical protein